MPAGPSGSPRSTSITPTTRRGTCSRAAFASASADETIDAPAGTTVFVEKGTPHAYGNPSPEPARYLLVMTPRIQQLIVRLHEGDWKDVHELFREHESELLPPPAQS